MTLKIKIDFESKKILFFDSDNEENKKWEIDIKSESSKKLTELIDEIIENIQKNDVKIEYNQDYSKEYQERIEYQIANAIKENIMNELKEIKKYREQEKN